MMIMIISRRYALHATLLTYMHRDKLVLASKPPRSLTGRGRAPLTTGAEGGRGRVTGTRAVFLIESIVFFVWFRFEQM